MRSFAFVLTLLGLAAASALEAQEVYPPSEAYRLRLEYRFWHPSLDSQIREGTQGTEVDETDLGIGDERTFEARGALQLARGHKLRGSYARLDLDGDVEFHRFFRFGSTEYPHYARVVTSMKGGYYTGDYQFDVFKGSQGYLGGLVGARIFDLDALLVAPAEGKREQETLRAPIPVLGITGRVYAGRVSFSGEVAGLTIGKKGHLFELQISAAGHVSDRLAVTGGYRMLALHGETDEDSLNFRLGGWHFGGEVSF